MIPKHELSRLSLADKRAIARALLQSAFDAPRSFPLSSAQEQIWFMDRLQPGSAVYNIPLYVPFSGALDACCLERAIATLAARHDMLRARFAEGGGRPVQIIEPRVETRLSREDVSRRPPGERSAALARLLNEELQRPFDLAAGPPIRYRLFRVDAAHHLLSVTLHHIIADAWSLAVYVAELRDAYEAYRAGRRDAPLPPLQLEYADYARWQREHLRGLRLERLLGYWTGQLAGAPHVLAVPTDHPRPKDQTFRGTVTGFVLDDALSEALIALARRERVTTFMLLLACYYVLLYRYTGQEDLLVGAPVAGRGRPELEPVIGLFVNTLILRARVRETATFAELLGDVQRMALGAFEHQALPFGMLVDALKVERVPGYPPLYQVVFNFQNADLIESDRPSAEMEALHEDGAPLVHSGTAKVDLNLTITQNGSRISGGFEYNSDLFEPQTIEGMLAHFRQIAAHVARDPSTPLMDIPFDDPGDDAGADAARLDLGSFSFEGER